MQNDAHYQFGLTDPFLFVCLLVLFSGIMVIHAVDAVRTRKFGRYVFVAISFSLVLLSSVTLYVMFAGGLPNTVIADRSNGWRCDSAAIKEPICFRDQPAALKK